jgi:CRP-like cAMP-binding protein
MERNVKKYLSVLQSCPLFEGIAPAEILSMLNCLSSQLERFDKKEILLAEGDAAGHIGLVLEGAVRIEQTDYFGNRSILGQAGPGELFGESFACADGGPLPVSVVAEEACEIMLLGSRRISTSCAKACGFHSKLIYNLLKVVSRRNLVFNRKLEILSKRTTREKLMTYLMYEAKRQGSRDFTIPFDRQALADYLGVERSAMSAELGKLQRDGVLTTNRNQFCLL